MFGDRNTGRILGACCGKNKREKKRFFFSKINVKYVCILILLHNDTHKHYYKIYIFIL